MFDISMSELGLCFLVALIVLGPEKLPRLARTLGRWSGQAKHYMRNLTSELERETELADLKRQVQEAQDVLRDSAASVRDSAQSMNESAEKLLSDTHAEIKKEP